MVSNLLQEFRNHAENKQTHRHTQTPNVVLNVPKVKTKVSLLNKIGDSHIGHQVDFL